MSKLRGMSADHSDSRETLEVAVLNIRPGQDAAFESAFAEAQAIISASPGYCGHQLRRSIETAGRYILLVRWAALEDHTVGFRQSAAYTEWQQLLHHFYDPFPTVEHYVEVLP
jgi:heme-degrading monooxygenase HmoA